MSGSVRYLNLSALNLNQYMRSVPINVKGAKFWKTLPRVFRTLAAQNRRSVLLETAKEDTLNDKSFLFLDPVEELVAWTRDDLEKVLSEVDRRTAEGEFVAGFFTYECGEYFVCLSSREPEDENLRKPLAWLGVYSDAIEFDHQTGVIRGNISAINTDPVNVNLSAAIIAEELQISRKDYAEKLARIHEYLSAGHTYQVNFTDRVCGLTNEEPLSVYETLLRQQPVPFAAYVNSPYQTILSFSPELFYRLSRGEISARPMKGTWPRGVNIAGDREAAELLRTDEKNRSEHIMIVDLLRNDLGRLCEYGSIHVDELFHVERYNTLHQMTSLIAGKLHAAITPSRVFRTLFPSGSITGAPKRRTMEIIRELERYPRGIYTGAIGYFGPDNEACFNVAIRTLNLEGKQLTLGVGGGITAGSVAQQEYEECRLKAAFLTRRRPEFSLIETMRCENGISLLDLHMKRLADSADYFGICYDSSGLVAEIEETIENCGDKISRVRLELNEKGDWAISASPLESVAWHGRILLVEENTDSRNIFLHHKTTVRHFYERNFTAAHQAGFDEVLFMNECSQLTEGAISNFFFRIRGKWLTPRLSCGVLPGVQRTVMLQSLDGAEECDLVKDDLVKVDSIFSCNALRGLRTVQSIETIDGTPLWAALSTYA